MNISVQYLHRANLRRFAGRGSTRQCQDRRARSCQRSSKCPNDTSCKTHIMVFSPKNRRAQVIRFDIAVPKECQTFKIG